MRLTKSEALLLKAITELRALITSGADDRALGAWLRQYQPFRRASESVLTFLPGSTPVSVITYKGKGK